MNDRYYDQDVILGYVEGELDDAQRASFESVIADDHELRNLVAQMKLDRQALRSLGMKPAPIGLVDRVIQTQERAALLGEPEVPEPLPMVLPVSRHKLRRVLAYCGVAAVLLLSAALVIPTLMPSGLLDRQSQVARRDTGSGAGNAKRPRNGGYALHDEDAAYDRAAARSSARPDPDATLAAKRTTPEPATAIDVDAGTPEVKIAEAQPTALAKAQADTTKAIAKEQAQASAAPAPAPAVAERIQTPGPVSPPRETAAALTEPVKPQADAPAGKVELAKAEPVNPFAGYARTGADTNITDHSQLLINTASPTLARRDLRDWAIANSARVEEQDASAGFVGTLGRAVTTPGHTPSRGIAATPDARGTSRPDGGASTQLTVEIDPAQVPKLLAYLNRNADQRAELVAQADDITAAPAAGRDGQRQRRAERPAREAEPNPPADQTTALTNSMVDTRSPWPKPNLVTGLVPTQPDADQATSKEEPAPQPDEPRQADATAVSPDNTDPAAPKPFDWGNLLDAVVNQPAATPGSPGVPAVPGVSASPTPLLPPEPASRVRLTVIIRQAPADAPAKQD